MNVVLRDEEQTCGMDGDSSRQTGWAFGDVYVKFDLSVRRMNLNRC